MNAMCNISQFLVVVPVPDKSAAILEYYFMKHVLLKFGMCHLVVLDDSIPIKGAFIVICEALNLNHDVFTKRNHKGITVEHFHRFLNNNVAIAAEERGMNNIFVPTGVTVPINGTEILRSIPTISRELRHQSQCFTEADLEQRSSCIRLFEIHRFFS